MKILFTGRQYGVASRPSSQNCAVRARPQLCTLGQLANTQGQELYKFPLSPNAALAFPGANPHHVTRVTLENKKDLLWKVPVDIVGTVCSLNILMNMILGFPLKTDATTKIRLIDGLKSFIGSGKSRILRTYLHP